MGLFLTSILQSTWEDLLAVALASLAGYVAVLGLPLRRGDIKGKLEKAAGSLAEVRGAASSLILLVGLAWEAAALHVDGLLGLTGWVQLLQHLWVVCSSFPVLMWCS